MFILRIIGDSKPRNGRGKKKKKKRTGMQIAGTGQGIPHWTDARRGACCGIPARTGAGFADFLSCASGSFFIHGAHGRFFYLFLNHYCFICGDTHTHTHILSHTHKGNIIYVGFGLCARKCRDVQTGLRQIFYFYCE